MLPMLDWHYDRYCGKGARMKLIHAAVVVALCGLSISAAKADDARGASIPQLQTKVDAVLSKVLPAVVGLKKDGKFQGSGVIVTQDGIVLTHGHHGLSVSDALSIVLTDGRVVSARLSLWKKSPLYDFSILQIDGKGPWPHVELGEMDRVHPGAWCLHLGHPWGIKPGRGPVPRMGWIVEAADVVLSSSCMIVSGDSGSPLFDDGGRLIGTCFGLNSLTTDYPANYTSVKVLRQAVAEFRDLEAKSHVVLRTRIDRRRSIPTWQAAWEPVRKATVQLLCDGKQRALGVIAHQNGLILTKRSELFGRISCRLGDDRTFAAKIVASSPSCDLALVQIPAAGLAAIPWAEHVRTKNGIVVVVPGSSQSVIGVGIVSDGRIQAIPPKPGRLALEAKQTGTGLFVTSLLPGSYAADVLRAGDVITNIDGHGAAALRGFSGIKEIASRVAGDRIPVAFVRQGTVQHAEVALSPERNGGEWERQSFSDRRSGFPSVFIHDTVIGPQECGGAVIDGSGRVLGINIARADRHETLTIPAEIVMQELQHLMRDANVHSDNRSN